MRSADCSAGFSLVEVTIALGVVAVCLVGIFGLLPTGLKTNRASNEQIAAIELAGAVDADLRSTPKTSTQSAVFAIPLATGATVYVKQDGTVGMQAASRWRVEVILNTPAGGSKSATSGRILVSWPAQQDDLTKAEGSEIVFIALDRSS